MIEASVSTPGPANPDKTPGMKLVCICTKCRVTMELILGVIL